MLIGLLLALWALADENVKPKGTFSGRGMTQVAPATIANNSPHELPPQHSIQWPVSFQDASHTIANSMAQFQPFGDPYFHGGCDLRTNPLAEVITPVSGVLEAGHYGYETNADGSMTKFWTPWPGRGDETYFEVAVVTSQGLRYEFHHIDRSRLPSAIIEKLRSANPTVEAGTIVGHVLRWPGFNGYHHMHYNVVLPSGVRVNPEFISPIVKDTLPPVVRGIYAISVSGQVQPLTERLSFVPQEIIAEVVDQKDQNPYFQPPVQARLVTSQGISGWDFSKTLTAADGRFPNLWSVFKDELRIPGGKVIRTDGGYGTGQSLLRLPFPPEYRGKFTIEFLDIAGNKTTIESYL